MFRILYAFFVAALILGGCNNNNLEINCSLINPEAGKYIYLDELRSNSLVPVDSVMVPEDGSFRISRRVEFPSLYLLRSDNTNFLTMLLEPGQKIEMKADFDSLNYPVFISGSKGTELMIRYNLKLQQTIKQLSMLYDIYTQKLGTPELPVEMERLDSIAQTYLNDMNSYTKKYIDENLNSLVSLVALYAQVAPREYVLPREKNLKYFIKVDSSLSLLYPDYEPVKLLHKEVGEMVSNVDSQNQNDPVPGGGIEAPEISLPGPGGDTINLSSTRGKVVLLDFWASWCRPCREENPNLVKAYNLYRAKGFQIFQVSLDKTREAWLKGIQDDHLEKWIHVSDIKYWNSIVVPLYKIESIPCNFLLDAEGRIIAANLRGEKLQTKLAELFNK